jgi:metallo-beta-lactamase family protein
MAISATELFCPHTEDHRLTLQECARLHEGVTFVRTAEESKRLTPLKGPMIVVSASGMATGGRVLHHLRTVAPDHRNTIVFVGFQAAGTRGEAMVHGARDIKIFGEYIPVRAEVVDLEGLSAHADADELLAWLGGGDLAPTRAFVVHGEPSAADALRRRLRDQLRWDTYIPEMGETVEL